MTGVSPTAWMFFAAAGIDPLWDVVSGVPPGAPADLTATATGRTVTLTWTAAAGAVTSYIVDAGTGPGLTNVGTFPVGATTTLVAPGVPAGTYYVRLRAAGPGGTSAASAEVIVTVR
jgi:hypothetical protein